MLVSDPQMLAPPGKHVIRVGNFASHWHKVADWHSDLYCILELFTFFTEPYHLFFISPSDSFWSDFMEKPAPKQFY